MKKAFKTGLFCVVCVLVTGLLGGCGGGGGSDSSPQIIPAQSVASGDVELKEAAPSELWAPALTFEELPAPVLETTGVEGGRSAATVWGGCPGTPPPQGAWSADSLAGYAPSRAFDGEYGYWWAGLSGAGAWDLYYGFGNVPASPVLTMDRFSISFYGTAYIPTTVRLHTSNDGCNWTLQGTLSSYPSPNNAELYLVLGSTVVTNYIWIEMDGNPTGGTQTPIIQDVDWEPVNLNARSYARPGAMHSVYKPSNAFDGNLAGQPWAGSSNAGTWNLYYHFDTPQDVQMATAHLYSTNYHPTTMTVYTSNDGINWSSVGEMGPLAQAAQFVNQTVNYLRIEMTGNPPSTFPYVNEVTWDIPAGASSGDSLTNFYSPDKAFDGNPSSWWAGLNNKNNNTNEWNLFYRYGSAQYLDTVTIDYYSVNHMPAQTDFYCHNGTSWSLVGTFPLGANPSLVVDTTCEIIRFHMKANANYPPVGYTLIKDIHFGDGWVEVGAGAASGAGISGTGGIMPEIDVDTLGNPYVAYVYWVTDHFEIYAKKWAYPNWVSLGTKVADVAMEVDDASLDIAVDSQNRPFVTWEQFNGTGVKVYGKRWNGAAWEELGGSASGDGISGASNGVEVDVAIDSSDRPYVAWVAPTGSSLEIYVKRWNGTTWEELGGSASGGGISNTNNLGSFFPSITIDASDHPVVAWRDATLSPFTLQIYVRRWNGTVWEELNGSGSGGGVSNTSTPSQYPEITTDASGNPVVAWTEHLTADNSETYVRRWNGTTWEELSGSGSGGGISNSALQSTKPFITMDVTGNNPLVAWTEYQADNAEVYVLHWNGSAWEELDGSATGGGVSDTAGYSYWSPITFGMASNPIVAWTDSTSGTANIYVKRWLP